MRKREILSKFKRHGEKLENLSFNLKKLCHAKECKFYEDCPREHDECSILLTTGTAMVWNFNQRILLINENLSELLLSIEYLEKNDDYMLDEIVERIRLANRIGFFILQNLQEHEEKLMDKFDGLEPLIILDHVDNFIDTNVRKYIEERRKRIGK